MRMTGFFGPAEPYAFFLVGPRNIPSSRLWTPPWDGEDLGSTWQTSPRHLKTAVFNPLKTLQRSPSTPGSLSMMNPPPPMSSSSHGGSPNYPKMVSRVLIPSIAGYLGGSSLYSIVIA
jgi:hypothetical protein